MREYFLAARNVGWFALGAPRFSTNNFKRWMRGASKRNTPGSPSIGRPVGGKQGAIGSIAVTVTIGTAILYIWTHFA